MDQSLKLVAQLGALTLSTKIIGASITFAISIILARGLGPVGFGLYSLGLRSVNIARSAGTLGMQSGVVRFAAIQRSQNDLERLKGTVIASLLLPAAFSLITASVLWLSSDFVANRLFGKTGLGTVLRGFAAALPFYALLLMSTSALQAFRRVGHQQTILNIVYPVLNILMVALLFWSGFGMRGAILAFATSAACGGFLGLYWLIQTFPLLCKHTKAIWDTFGLLRYSFPIFLHGIAYLLMNSLGLILLGVLMDSEAVGNYSAAATVAYLVPLVLIAIIPISAPIMAELYHMRKRDELERLFQRITCWTTILTIPIFIVLVFGADLVIGLFGSQYTQAGSILTWLALGQLVNAGTGPIAKLMEMADRQMVNLLSVTLNLALNLLLCLLLIPRFGAVGAAIATSVSLAVTFAVIAIATPLVIGIRPYNRNSLKPIAAGAIAIVMGFTAVRLLDLSAQGANWFTVLLMLSIYPFALLAVGLSAEDRQIISALYRKRR